LSKKRQFRFGISAFCMYIFTICEIMLCANWEVPLKFHWIIWIPRSIMVITAVFMMLFSLDIFEEKAGILKTILGLFMHNIPSLIMLLALIFTWKRPFWGGMFFVVLAVAFSIWISICFTKFLVTDLLAFALPMLISGAFFFFVHFKSKQRSLS